MSAYRFCRTDDIGLLVDALNRCWLPHCPGEEPETPASFKLKIRELQVWCSSCMVAFAGSDPIGVLIGAKRQTSTLIYRIAVHPDHQRQGHGRHLLQSLASKLSILGPPRMVAEIPDALPAANALFRAVGYTEEAVLTDYEWTSVGASVWAGSSRPTFIIPVTLDDLAANGLLEPLNPPHICWERSLDTLAAKKPYLSGLGVASSDRIEACILYIEAHDRFEICSLRSFVEDDGAALAQLMAGVAATGITRLAYPKVHPDEISQGMLRTLGFRPAGVHRRYAARAAAA